MDSIPFFAKKRAVTIPEGPAPIMHTSVVVGSELEVFVMRGHKCRSFLGIARKRSTRLKIRAVKTTPILVYDF